MASLNREQMKLDSADRPAAVALSSVVVLGSIIVLMLWSIQAAYL